MSARGWHWDPPGLSSQSCVAERAKNAPEDDSSIENIAVCDTMIRQHPSGTCVFIVWWALWGTLCNYIACFIALCMLQAIFSCMDDHSLRWEYMYLGTFFLLFSFYLVSLAATFELNMTCCRLITWLLLQIELAVIFKMYSVNTTQYFNNPCSTFLLVLWLLLFHHPLSNFE